MVEVKDSWLSALMNDFSGTVTLRKQLSAFHIQVRQRKEHMKLETVLLEPPVPHLREVPEIFDHMKRMLDLGTNGRVLSVLLPLR